MSLHPITASLLHWYRPNRRDLPWRNTSNPYFIWLSEVILQQTRVDQGTPYYHHFTETYPSVHHLAEASEDHVLRSWQGLGYYSRARNLHAAAQDVVQRFGGTFPNTYEGIRSLKGVGDYTAAAIASIAFNLPHAAIDGNVIRVLSRLFALDADVQTAPAKQAIAQLAAQLLPAEQAGDFNQAMMELGATVCKPKQAQCEHCPLRTWCLALKANRVYDFPQKGRKTAVRPRYFHYFVCIDPQHRVWLEQRKGNDIWQGLYQFPLVESAAEALDSDALPKALRNLTKPLWVSKTYQHKLSHQTLHVQFRVFQVNARFKPDHGAMEKVSFDTLESKALPRLILRFLEDYPQLKFQLE